ncbi:MAG: hypothetical protein II696_05755 [Firmicutes bacterium]|nr:hypothetical protein [Bacillota bacterium]
MRKTKSLIAVLIAVIVMSAGIITGCGSDEPTVESGVTDAVNGFMESMQIADLAGMYEYAEDEAIGDCAILGFVAIDDLEKQLSKDYGIRQGSEEGSNTENFDEAIILLKERFLAKLVTSYEVTHVFQDGHSAEAELKVNYGFDVTKVGDIDISKDVEGLAEAYRKDHKRASKSDAMMAIINDVCRAYERKAFTGEVTKEAKMTLKKGNHGWKVTSYEIQ